MITVRSIIVEALDRANLVSRRRSAPAEMTETAFRLFKGIAGKYSNDNLLQFIMSEAGANLTKQDYILGETDGNAPEAYEPVDVAAPKIQKVCCMFWRPKSVEGLGSWAEAVFVSPEEFDAYPNGSSVYTCQPINDLQVRLHTKLLPDENIEWKVIYNRKWVIGLDDDLRIPEQYVELFITALTHKLAVVRPRLSQEQVNILKTELTEMENNVRVTTRAVKYVSRKPSARGVNRVSFLTGSMFLPG